MAQAFASYTGKTHMGCFQSKTLSSKEQEPSDYALPVIPENALMYKDGHPSPIAPCMFVSLVISLLCLMLMYPEITFLVSYLSRPQRDRGANEEEDFNTCGRERLICHKTLGKYCTLLILNQ